jgi:hypothetical protein
MLPDLTHETYDGAVSALTGNGTLCTTLGPTGYHVPPDQWTDRAHQTQVFVMAGRRRRGPDHPLVDFGSICRTLQLDGEPPSPISWRQSIDFDLGVVSSEWTHEGIEERTRSFVALRDNVFIADTVLTNTSERAAEVELEIRYRCTEPGLLLTPRAAEEGVHLQYTLEELRGDIRFDCQPLAGEPEVSVQAEPDGASARLCAHLPAGAAVAVSTSLHFSDRLQYEEPVFGQEVDAAAERHEAGWSEFWSRSQIVTGDALVDDFRRASLYTLRCQMTPWSIPASLSHPYWGGGAFHDEMYPFLGLLAANHPDLAERIPYFRLTTLPEARKRARARGALYPWSSTEFGEERDPTGPWLTERFHLGQFAVCIRALWQYERSRLQLEDLYPVLRDLARYFEMNMLERQEAGGLRTIRCMDFDESVGLITNGPFTIAAAIATMEFAASAARELGVDAERAGRWEALAGELRPNLLVGEDGLFGIPEGKALHSSVMGPVFPFGIEVDTERARATTARIHEVCRSDRGWKPGFSEVFTGSNWMWTAGHLGAVHACQGNGELAWEAVRHGPESAGAFLSPNEHVDRHGAIQVPWFTTGCGAWLYALHALFVQVNDEGTKLLPAVSAELKDWSFRGLRAAGGVLVSGRCEGGLITSLSAIAPQPMAWHYQVPGSLLLQDRLVGFVQTDPATGLNVVATTLPSSAEISLLQ